MKQFRNTLAILPLFFLALTGRAQPFLEWSDSIQVMIGSTTLVNPWAGGLNFVQPSAIDMDLDGVKDLFMFDKSGDKVRTFINNGTTGVVDYSYDPYYETKFPQLHDWAILVDYNCDGKEDIFSYSDIAGGFKVFKNTSSIPTGLQFTMVSPLVYSVFNPPLPGLVNLYVTRTDIPAIADIDNDGDMDVITFGSGASNMEYHKNLSMELYGTCDSLKFQMANRCWGYASEHPMNNGYTLYDTCMGNVSSPELAPTDDLNREAVRHTGSCQLCIDLDNDTDKEFIVGDISYPNLTMLTNGGTPTDGSFVAIDTVFPANNASTSAVDLSIFPCAFYLDVNSDGLKDLIVSPSSPNSSENFNSVVYYKNTGTNSFPVFQYQQSNMLQEGMIDLGEGAYPAFFDYDNDGLKDLFVGNYGYYGTTSVSVHQIAQFRNIGTPTIPKYQLITRDYDGFDNTGLPLSTLGISNMVPAFGDLDADGDSDMVIGGDDGKVHYFRNTAAAGALAHFVLITANIPHSLGRPIDVGNSAAPQIVDMDANGTNDLVIGARGGKLAYYKHIGSSAIPVFDSMTHFFGGIKVNLPGYTTGYTYPFVFKQGGVTNMLVGQESGFIRRYNNIDGNLAGNFTWVDSTFLNIFQGTRTAPFGADINNDGLMDLIVGNYQGGLSFYRGVTALTTSNLDNFIHFNFELFPNPANNSFTLHILNEDNKIYLLELYNVMGQLITTETINDNTLTLQSDTYKAGIYVCKVSEVNAQGNKRSGALTKRIIIQH